MNKNTTVSVKLSEKERELLEQKAMELGVSMSWIIRQALQDYFAKDG